jgi:hypothetical protein
MLVIGVITVAISPSLLNGVEVQTKVSDYMMDMLNQKVCQTTTMIITNQNTNFLNTTITTIQDISLNLNKMITSQNLGGFNQNLIVQIRLRKTRIIGSKTFLTASIF